MIVNILTKDEGIGGSNGSIVQPLNTIRNQDRSVILYSIERQDNEGGQGERLVDEKLDEVGVGKRNVDKDELRVEAQHVRVGEQSLLVKAENIEDRQRHRDVGIESEVVPEIGKRDVVETEQVGSRTEQDYGEIVEG